MTKKKSAYTPFIRLSANVKRLLSKIPGGGSKLGSFAAGLFLIKEKYGFTDKNIKDICEKVNVDVLDFLNESNEWFMLEDKQISPGIYKVYNPKLLNSTCDELVWPKDEIRIEEECFPIGDIFGVDIYEAVHMKTQQRIYIALSEIYK